jgi:hypothetical protein
MMLEHPSLIGRQACRSQKDRQIERISDKRTDEQTDKKRLSI